MIDVTAALALTGQTAASGDDRAAAARSRFCPNRRPGPSTARGLRSAAGTRGSRGPGARRVPSRRDRHGCPGCGRRAGVIAHPGAGRPRHPHPSVGAGGQPPEPMLLARLQAHRANALTAALQRGNGVGPRGGSRVGPHPGPGQSGRGDRRQPAGQLLERGHGQDRLLARARRARLDVLGGARRPRLAAALGAAGDRAELRA